MAIYGINGAALLSAYGKDGTGLSAAYDINGVQVFGGSSPTIDPMDWSGMSATYKGNVDSAINYAQSYVSQHAGAYAFPVLSDVHDKLYNEPNYVLYNHSGVFDKFLFMGDIANSFSKKQMDDATAYTQEADSVDVLALIGNHEFGEWEEGDDLPKEWYEPLIPESCVSMSGDSLVYYFDDTANNVRFIVLDSCTPIYQSAGTQLVTKNQLEFFASALDSSGSKDIILLNHAPGQGYYYVTDTGKENYISTTGITNRATMDAIINAFIARESYTFSDDSSVSHTHDYSGKTGKFVGLIAGHTHHAGFNNANGYNVYICPSSYYNTDAGMSVFVIDPVANKVIFVIGYKNNETYGVYEYSY